MTLNRRDFIKAASAFGLGSGLLLPTQYLSAASSPISDHKLVVLFLAGGHDSVNAFVPFNETNYYTLRPTLGITAGNLLMPNNVNPSFDFGFNPALAGLKPIYDNGDMALFPAAHNGAGASRSHFSQFENINQGRHTSNVQNVAGTTGGWLNNYLEQKYGTSSGIEAFNFNSSLRALEGGFPHLKLSDPSRFSLGGSSTIAGQSQSLLTLFRQNNIFSGLSKEITDSQVIVDRNQAILKSIDFDDVQNGANYSNSSLANKLKRSVALFRNVPEFKVAFMSQGGWDLHSNQASRQTKRLQDLGDSIKAFYDDLGAERNNVTLVVMSEFGRTAKENGSQGTDHGAGTAYFMIGGSQIKGGVQGAWPGYDDADLERERYLRPTTDYRNLLVEALDWIDDGSKLSNTQLSSPFAEYTWDRVKRYTV